MRPLAPMTTKESPAPPPQRLDTRLEASGLVFVGVGLHWKSRPSDLQTNMELAEEWQEDFPVWGATGRDVTLQDQPQRYRVNLSDGSAQFRIETATGYDLAVEHMGRLLERVPAARFAGRFGRIEVQFLRSTELEFSERVEKVAPRLLNDTFPTSQRAEMQDFAYLMDFEIDGRFFQVNIGVVRKHEVSHRVTATIVKPPAVGTFYNITHRWKPEGTADDLARAFDRTLSVGRGIVDELE